MPSKCRGLVVKVLYEHVEVAYYTDRSPEEEEVLVGVSSVIRGDTLFCAVPRYVIRDIAAAFARLTPIGAHCS